MGVMKSRGKFILFADADGASKFSDFQKLESSVLKNGHSLEVRSHKIKLESTFKFFKIKFIQKFLMKINSSYLTPIEKSE